MKKKIGKPFLRWRVKKAEENQYQILNRSGITTEAGSDVNQSIDSTGPTTAKATPPSSPSVAKNATSTTRSSSPTSSTLATQDELDEKAHTVTPERDADDYSLYIVHTFVDGEITKAGTPIKNPNTERLDGESSPLVERIQVDGGIPTIVRSITSQSNNGTEENALLDDDISAISFDKDPKKRKKKSQLDDDISAISFDKMLKFSEDEVDDFVEDNTSTIKENKVKSVGAKKHMIKNIATVKWADDVKGCETSLQDDEFTYGTLDDEWEDEFGAGCCFSKQLHNIVDWAGEPEDYPIVGHLAAACEDGQGVE